MIYQTNRDSLMDEDDHRLFCHKYPWTTMTSNHYLLDVLVQRTTKTILRRLEVNVRNEIFWMSHSEFAYKT